ncbi:MAG: DUF4214 domain-containing protein [Acidimicrobiales bacterium]
MLFASPSPLRRLFNAATTVVVAALAVAAVVPTAEVATAAEVRLITLPVHRDRVDDVHWTDTWGAARSGGRSHIGVDMMGDKMIPLVAARTGTVTWGRYDNGGGSLLRFRDDDGWEYQYIHINNDTPGTDDGQATCAQAFSARICATVGSDGRLRPGTRITEGEVIAFLGDSGNAESTAPHLHFEVYEPTPAGLVAVNPTPIVDAALARLRASPTSAGSAPAFAAPGQTGFADYLWFTIHGRYPTVAERSAFDSEAGANGVWTAVGDQVDDSSTAATIDRLYLAFFQRYPDAAGIQYWIGRRGAGHPTEAIAEWFAESDEFTARYGGLPFGQFLDRLYLEVLGRTPDPGGKAYWLQLLERGTVTRGTIVVYFTESDEMRGITDHRNELVALELLRRGEVPTDAGVAAWSTLRAGRPLAEAVAEWYQA